MELYDAKKDEQFSRGYIDIDEMRVRKLENGCSIPFRYMHGGFEGTPVKFSFCFPEKDRYEGRFYQYLSPFPGPEEELASIPVTGIDDKIAFCLTHGAYYVESNMGSGAIFTNSDDHTMTHRSSAASAEFSRIKAQEVYGYEHRPYGYVYGGSGGGYRTIACIENTNAFDGAAPYVIGSPYAIPNCQTTRAHAERLLRNKLPQIIDAVDAGGSGDPYAGLNEEEADALREATFFGYPSKSWFASADLDDGSLSVLLPGIKAMDPDYFEDFWKKPGYLGADKNSSAVRERICMDTRVKLVYEPNRKEKALQKTVDTRNGVNDAWKKMISSASEKSEPWIELAEIPVGENLYLKGAQMEFLGGEAKGKKLQIGRIEDNRVYIIEGFGMDTIAETISLVNVGDEVHLDNSDYIAVQTYHRHQVPTPDYRAWDQFRDEEGTPLYPQQKNLVGPIFCGMGPGCEQNGRINGKIIIVAALMDEQAYPWQADWYRRKVASVHGGKDEDYCRLWYFDNVLHGDITGTEDELHVTSYVAGLKQALIDLAAWVEKGIEPLPSSNYTVDIGHVCVPETAAERGGIQPVANLRVNGEKCAHAKVGETISFEVEAEVPEGAGTLTFVEWSFEGEEDFPVKGEFTLCDGGVRGSARQEHTYLKPGIYFGVVRVKSERHGDKSELFTQVRNIDRVRVIVEA
ncbi:MAG: PKD domain-containing protein [Lachnospiraceae bacterium]|nr:PKD domain-containing protein [Lachnospiraceae bacterium]